MTGKKREQLLDCAATLFRANGFRATGIDRILAASGCAKMTLYNHFGSKEELMLACVRRADEAWRTAVAAEIEHRSSNPRERLLALFDVASDIVGDDNFCGCFFLRAAHEFHDPDDPVHAAAADNKRQFTHYLTGIAAAAGAAEPESLAKSLLMLLDGAISYVHVCGDASAATLARRNAAMLIERYLM